MADFPLFGGGVNLEAFGVSTSTSLPTSVTAGARTYSAYVELIAATTFSYDGIHLFFSEGASAGAYICTLAIGAAGTEVAIATDVHFNVSISSTLQSQVFLPLHVPTGSRIAIKASVDSLSTQAVRVGGLGIAANNPRGWTGFQRATGYGDNADFSVNPLITASGTANTKGNWTEITASSANPVRAAVLILGRGPASDLDWLVDFGIGAAGSEVVFAPNVPFHTSVNFNGQPSRSFLVPVDVPAGSRLAARGQVHNTDTAVINVGIIGLD